MKNSIWVWVIGIIIVAGAAWALSGPDEENRKPQLANPASVNCSQKLGGTLEIRNEASGQVGYCHLPDGRICEEWALYQGGVCTSPVTASSTPPVATSTTGVQQGASLR